MPAEPAENVAHATYVERSSNRRGEDIFYAWCGHPDCFWHSPRRTAQLTVEEFARKHQRERSEQNGSPESGGDR
jgi:hypothetical protein